MGDNRIVESVHIKGDKEIRSVDIFLDLENNNCLEGSGLIYKLPEEGAIPTKEIPEYLQTAWTFDGRIN